MSAREYLDFCERIERDEDEQLVCDLLGEYIARREQDVATAIEDVLDRANAAGRSVVAGLCSAIAFYELHQR